MILARVVVDTQAPIDVRAQLDACTHCGLCLESCPTYTLWGREADSPRGRLTLIEDALGPVASSAALVPAGKRTPPARQAANAALVEHIDACVGCNACVSACPEGVRYDAVLDLARGLVRGEQAGRPLRRGRDVVLRTTLASPRRLRALAPAVAAARRTNAKRAPEPVKTLAALPLAAPSARQLTAAIPHFTASRGRRRGHVALLLGCTERVFASDLQRIAVAVLAAEGYDVSAPAEPGCCGGWARELGDLPGWHEAAGAAQQTLARVGDVDAVLTLAGRCADAMAGHAHAPTDIIAFLAAVGPQAARGRLDWRVAYHASCQQRHAEATQTLLATIPGVRVSATVDACCGGRGLYPVRRPQAATALVDLAIAELTTVGPQAIVSDEPSCAEQLTRGLAVHHRELPVLHPLQLLWLSLQQAK